MNPCAVRPTGGAGMAVQLHGRGQLPHGGPQEAAAHHRHSAGRHCHRHGASSRSCGRRRTAGTGTASRRRVATGGARPRKGAQQAVAHRAMQLGLPPARAPATSGVATVPGVRGHLAVRVRYRGACVPGQEAVEACEEEGGVDAVAAKQQRRRRCGCCCVGGGRGGREAVPALRDRQDASVEDGAAGPQDAVQRVRCAVQVGAPRAGVPSGGEPDVRGVQALQLPPEGAGAAPPEGGAPAPAPAPPVPATAAAGAARPHRRRRWRGGLDARAEPADVRRAGGAAHRRRLLDPQPPHRAGLPSAHLGTSSSGLFARSRVDPIAQQPRNNSAKPKTDLF